MKNIRQTSRIILTSVLLSIAFVELFGQNSKADKKIMEIESFKKYKIKTIDTAYLKILGDSATEITEVILYAKKSKNNSFGKVTVSSKTDFSEIKRTLYINEKDDFFAIIDNIKHNDNTIERLTYYLEGEQSFEVFNQNGKSLTNTIDRKQFEYSVKLMFTKLLQQQFQN